MPPPMTHSQYNT